jgi:hypothetical protein
MKKQTNFLEKNLSKKILSLQTRRGGDEDEDELAKEGGRNAQP